LTAPVIDVICRADGTWLNEPDVEETRNWVLNDLLSRWEPSLVERLGALVDDEVRERCARYDRVVEAVELAEEIAKVVEPVYEILEELQGYEVSSEVAIDPQRGRMGGLQGQSALDQSEAGGVRVSPDQVYGLSVPGPGSALVGY
jgi:hypothetical protein